ncbi:LuxR C-terminal-related transcriptional regulator [Defluviimonas aestuarii]|uniref:helix-turn-helix transcriptional regulator n=1 Tax=Albidovulum aestuarii TaxID=1130726 RepID=UPI00249CAE1D|nr:LuxR family transcriptional regulator [Defluviimonas aestuarii]MDI3337256.1 LuxR C-terminal-related transcriptional regulator [Defluviimonas aestuarii]
MTKTAAPARTKGAAIVLLMLVQGFCAAFFLGDLIIDFYEEPKAELLRPHFAMEVLANLGLVAGVVFEGAYLMRLLRRQAHADRALSVASGALHEVMEGYFEEWRLTPAEADVASFTIKGCSIAEIAQLRGSAEGTVKTHLNAIYRKAGVSGRGDLINLLIDEILGGELLAEGARTQRA